MSDDAKRGRELAELARQFFVWLRENELPGLPGLKGVQFDFFQAYAGIYRKLKASPQRVLDNRLLPNLWLSEPAEQQRFRSLKLGVSYFLLVNNHHDLVFLPDGRREQRNRILLAGKKPLEQDGALMTVEPLLDSLEADDRSLGVYRNYDFSAILNRTDLVYDEATTAVRFRYPSLLAFDVPRRAFLVNVQDIIPPAELDPGPVNDRQAILAKRVREFREYLYYFATYENRKYVKNRGGGHYEKWLSKDSRRRDFRPTQLSKDYLKENFTEHVMKQGDNLLLLDLGTERRLFRLGYAEPKRTAAAPMKFTVQALVTIGGTGTPARVRRADDDAPERDYRFPITAVFFHALDGADHLPTFVSRGNLEYRGGPAKRFLVDYRAFVRWYFGDQRLKLGSDREWFDKFVEVLFGDQSYLVELHVIRSRVDRESLFLAALRAEASNSSGPIAVRLRRMVEWCDEDPDRYFLTQGLRQGTEDNPRELIGVAGGSVFEWHPNTGIVSRMEVSDWLDDSFMSGFSTEVARNTAGMLPFINLITWGGVVVASGGVLGLGSVATATVSKLGGGSLGAVSRTAIVELVRGKAGQVISKQAAKKARPQLIAMMAEGVMCLLPSSDDVLYRFLRGFVEGLGGGAVTHYLTEIDDRLERQIGKLPAAAANIATKGGFRAYVIYDKVSTAAIRIAGLAKSLKTVLTEERAKRVADELSKLGKYVGAAFLIILFVVVYLDFVYRSSIGQNKRDLDRWVKQQKDTLVYMVRETGQEIADHARDLQNELRAIKQKISGPLTHSQEAHAAVRRNEAALSGKVVDKLKRGFDEIPAIAEFLKLLLTEMDVEDFDELKRLGFGEIMARGFEALPKRQLAANQVEKLGSALGELIGTILIERQIVPKKVRDKGGVVFGHPQHQVARGALAGGTWRALWRFAIFPFQNLGEMPASLKRGLEEQASPQGHSFAKAQHRDTSYQDMLRDLLGDEDELARRLIRLAEEEGLKANLDRVIASANNNILPPDLEALTKGENADWPSDAILYILYTWLRLGLRQLLEVFNLIEDTSPYQGKFKLSDLLSIIGFDFPLNDATLADLKAKFTPAKTAEP